MIATGCHKMSSIDHLHTEAEMLKVREHSELLSAQYLARCLEPGNVCHPITIRAIPERPMKETLHPTTMIPSDLWSRRTDAVRELSYLEATEKRTTTLNPVQEFPYIGSIIARDCHIEAELQKRM